MQGGYNYNMNIRVTKSLCFVRTVTVVYFSVSACAEGTSYVRDLCAQHFWGFPFYRPTRMGISTLPPAGRKKTLSNDSTTIKNQTFGAGVAK